jgi:hypothetical protein
LQQKIRQTLSLQNEYYKSEVLLNLSKAF